MLRLVTGPDGARALETWVVDHAGAPGGERPRRRGARRSRTSTRRAGGRSGFAGDAARPQRAALAAAAGRSSMSVIATSSTAVPGIVTTPIEKPVMNVKNTIAQHGDVRDVQARAAAAGAGRVPARPGDERERARDRRPRRACRSR